jgi:two-component system, OmpR family, response regulator MprA
VGRKEPHRILVVDDEDAVCDVLQAYLASEGYEVECAKDGSQARAALARDRFDAVIIDLVLPDERGLHFAEHAASIGVPVMLMSGHPEFMKLADDLPYLSLQKPFRLALVLDLLRALTGSPRTRRPDTAALQQCEPQSGS